MDWIHALALIYVAVTTPLAIIGFVVLYMLGSAYFSAKDDRSLK